MEICRYCHQLTNEKVYGGASPENPGISFTAHKRCGRINYDVPGLIIILIVISAFASIFIPFLKPIQLLFALLVLLCCPFTIYLATKKDVPN